MNLVKSKTGGRKSDQCRGEKQDGNQCTRTKIFKDGLCKQHYKIHKDSITHISSYPGGTLKEVPDAPVCLTGMSANRWEQYCQLLLEYGELKGAYLEDICILCLAEEMRRDVIDDLKTEGRYNYYGGEGEDENKGSNINGPMVALQKLDNLISDKRKTYWMIPNEKRSKLFSGSGSKSKNPTMKTVNSGKDF